MSYYDENVYYSPEKHGLTLVTELELEEPDWSFYTLAVWAGEEGLYMGTDSGCSCPAPFENYNGIEDLTGPLPAEQVIEEADQLRDDRYTAKSFDEFKRVIETYK